MIKTQEYEEVRDPNAVLAELNYGYKKYKTSLFSNTNGSTLLALSPMSINIAETYYSIYCILLTFIVNFYEINKILGKYLDLWINNKELSYVRLTTFMTTYNVFNTGIMDKFFPNGRIYYNQFFQYVCIMALFEYNQIISLIMSMCRIHSNVFITKEQIITFVNTIDKTHQIDLRSFFDMHSMDLKDISAKTYSMKAFVGFINNSIPFQSIIYQLRLIVYTEIFPSKYQHIILNRYNYYTFMPNGTEVNKKPKESCTNRLKRIFNNEPSPFHYDYILVNNNAVNKQQGNNNNNNNSRNQIDDLLLLLKQNYGYGYRTSRTSRTCYSYCMVKGGARLSSSKSNQSTHSKQSRLSQQSGLQSRYSVCPIKESPDDNENKSIQRTTFHKKSKSFNMPKCYSNFSQRHFNVVVRARNESADRVIIP